MCVTCAEINNIHCTEQLDKYSQCGNTYECCRRKAHSEIQVATRKVQLRRNYPRACSGTPTYVSHTEGRASPWDHEMYIVTTITKHDTYTCLTSFKGTLNVVRNMDWLCIVSCIVCVGPYLIPTYLCNPWSICDQSLRTSQLLEKTSCYINKKCMLIWADQPFITSSATLTSHP